MPPVQKRTFSLAEEQAEYIDAKVEAGEFASASEVVRAGLRALKERDEAIKRWLHEEAGPAYDEMTADPSDAVPADDVLAEIRDRLDARLKAGN